MSHKRLWIAATIIGGIVLIGFALSVPHTRDVVESSSVRVTPEVPVVVVHDSFKKGLHTITGSVVAPNVCADVSTEARVNTSASTTDSILVVISISRDTGVCLELPTVMKFSTTIAAAARVPLVVTVNGVTASTTSL